MPALMKRALVLTLLITMAAIAFGTSRSPQPAANSPYASALYSYSVRQAEAAKHHCTNTGCLVLQGIQSCRGGEYPGTNCVNVSGQCQVTACP